MIAIIDYGVGNLFSLANAFKAIGAETVVTSDPEVIRGADKLVLPGVGAFGDARAKLAENGLDRLVIEEARGGKPLMGICLGMQMLFEKSYEYGTHEGLGLLKGSVVPMEGVLKSEYKIPHIGWNALKLHADSPLFKYIKEGDCVYFVHSYYATGCEDSLLATAEYDKDITACVGVKNVFGCQFHPEKSGSIGLNILRAFAETGGTL